MSENTQHSTKEEDFFGNKYTQHYDKKNKKDGWSESDENFWGKEYTQHHEQDGSKSGRSDIKETFWGDEYIQQYDTNGNNIGYSEKKIDFWGNEYTQHYDNNGNKIGTTEKKEDFFGNEYQEHDMEKDPSSQESSNSGTGWLDILDIGGWFSVLLSLAVIFAAIFVVIFAISAVIVTFPIWGGMLLTSTASTIVFAEALKSESDWALSILNNYESKSIWLGPIIATVFGVFIFLVMTIYRGSPGTLDVIVSLIIGVVTMWICRRTVTPIVRWRLSTAVKEKNPS